MKKLPPLVSTPLRFGAVGGALIILLFLGIYFFYANPLIVFRKFDFGFLLLPVFIFFSIREFRDYKNAGELRFWQGMTVGFLTYMVVAFCSAFFIWVFVSFFDPQLLVGYIADRTQLIEGMKDEMIAQLGESVYEQAYNEVQHVAVWEVALDDFLKKIFIGLFLTIIISVLLRK